MKKMRVLPFARTSVAACLILAVSAACGNNRDIKYEQVYIGVNAPENQFGPQYFADVAKLDSSWVKGAMDQASYQKLKSKIDFDRQVLLAFPVGKRIAFSGDLKITQVSQHVDEFSTEMEASALVGLLGDACKTDVVSFPFAVAIFDKPQGYRGGKSTDIGNFDAGCTNGGKQ